MDPTKQSLEVQQATASQAEKSHSSSDDESKHDVIRGQSFSSQAQANEYERKKMNALLANPLRGYSHQELRNMGKAYALDHALVEPEDLRAFQIGAVLAQNPKAWETVEGLREEEKEVLRAEQTHRWSQPKLLYLVIILCSTCAAVQGMDETVVNGAQNFYYPQFGIDDTTGPKGNRNTWLQGLVNSAPYLCCAFIGCWLSIPFNNWFGRRGTIFITCLFSALTCFWQAFTNTWWSMFIARFALGFGIGPKSATVPIYAAECSPPEIRGALVMQWQMWTAFGIMVGYAADLAFFKVPDKPGIHGLNWRIMMASAMLPAVIVCCFVFMVPESPRWYMQKGRHHSAYESLCRLRHAKIQAARDQFYMHKGLEAEHGIRIGQNKIKEIITVPRNRRAMLASEIVMFMQQFCGVNVIAYYSTEVFVQGGFPIMNALAASLGFGIINFLFAIPAVYTIDTFGRRNLLLTTFPLMSLFLLLTGFSFWIPLAQPPPGSDVVPVSKGRVAGVALGIYLFGIVYSPGEGPVPFTYSAEAYPLYIRTYGMSLATATTWFFNFVLSVTWPSLQKAFKPQGAFGWYAAWNAIGWWLVLLFLPETKARSLEELDAVFSVPTHKQMSHGLKEIPYFFNKFVFRRDVHLEPLIDFDAAHKNETELDQVIGEH
ncbi:MFS sugar transporter [Myriangium duriaei CBS 260.36]|uniref:MFS sugar transporter n=1 Tax=Myriangium duriaei CBS 260.36 TaxID=1168546 RepID=A0A9P4J2K8_9PEZI|nr:MFS sugar transporter [Myriangium duriaei CBS 260.36]